MWHVSDNARVFLALGVTDMRKAANGLAFLVEHELGGALFSGDLFAFCNRARDLVKILYWSRNGLCLWSKRLEKERFRWPKSEEEVLQIQQRELDWLLTGLDIRQAHAQIDLEAYS